VTSVTPTKKRKEQMKVSTKAALAILALGASAAIIVAQDSGQQAAGQGPRPHRPAPPVIAALDANHDGFVDESEIANASSALKTLDKNGDGKLTMDELMGPPPKRGGGPAGHHRPPSREGGQSAAPVDGSN
jgi:hypothetical protein